MNKRIEWINKMIADNTLDKQDKLDLLAKWDGQVQEEIMERPRHSSELKTYTDTLEHIKICTVWVNSL